MKNRKVIISLIFLSVIVFVLGLHGGSEYYFRDFCVHKALNMFYNNGSPEFFKKPGLVSDLYAIAYFIYYSVLHHFSIVQNMDEFVRYFTIGSIPTPKGAISFTLPALIVNNVFAALGVCFTFLTTYILTEKKIFPAFVSGLMLATSYIWMELSHHLAVDIPLTTLCIAVIFFTIYFSKNKMAYSEKDMVILGILSGLCIGAKYNGFIVMVAPLAILYFTEDSNRTKFRKMLILFICAFLTFYITNPYIFSHFSTFLSDFTYEYRHAFMFGHNSADDRYSAIFHLFHSFPNAIQVVPYLCSILGLMLFFSNPQVPRKIKYGLLSFPCAFFVIMSFSYLVFLRYMLPMIPVLLVFVGLLVDYLIFRLKRFKFMCAIVYFAVFLMLFQSVLNSFHFYRVTSRPDTRVIAKNILKSLNINKHTKIAYSDIFSNPYYAQDFLNQYPELKDNILLYLYVASNQSINIFPRRTRKFLDKYEIIVFDSGTYDYSIQVRKDIKYRNIEHQYYMYNPKRGGYFLLKPSKKCLYAVEINPYNIPKSRVPFNTLRSDWKYRVYRGPFIEIYFRDKNLRDRFLKECDKYSELCSPVNSKKGYYYTNLVNRKSYF